MKHHHTQARQRLATGLLLATLPFAWATSAPAQFGHFFNDAEMTPDDIALASQAAERLYTKAGVTVGEQVTWNNPKTDHKGVVDVLEVEAGPCVTIRHIATTRAKPDIRYYVRRCQQADGNWVLSPN